MMMVPRIAANLASEDSVISQSKLSSHLNIMASKDLKSSNGEAKIADLKSDKEEEEEPRQYLSMTPL